MEARYPHQLHVARDGAVRDRNALGYKGNGPILGWVRKRRENSSYWVVSLPGGTELPDLYRTRHDGVWALIETHQNGLPA
jgi:hypothetical protein